ncbi:MAG: PAS domain S-box protein [Alphaproteobacteria bacterium]|nr:MAG: PAS domain S-box protein [Alphaproteobacteria bacterium]
MKPAFSGADDRIAALEEELARLRESEKMYRTAVELSGRMVWAADEKGALTVMREPFSVVTGLGTNEALGEGWLDIVHPREKARVRGAWREAVENGATFNAEFRARTRDGYRIMRSRAVPIRDGDRVIGWSGTTQDVEEESAAAVARRAAEERLRESEELHRFTLELSKQIVWTVDEHGRLLTISPRFRELSGLDEDTPLDQAIHPEDRPMVLALWAQSSASGEPYRVKYRLRMADGSYRHMQARAAPRRDSSGRIVRWYGTLEDVHLQHEADFARKDVEERFRLAAQATNDAVWDHDFVAKTIDWSDNAAEILGIKKQRLGRTPSSWWDERIHPDEKLSLLHSLSEAVRGNARRWSGTYRFRRDDGSYADVLDRGFIIRDADGRAVRAVGAMADLTERHRAEAEIRRMQAELIQVSRQRAMGALASTLAHELNQPLAALANYVTGSKRLAENPRIPRGVLVDALDGAEQAAHRAGQILRRVRELVARGEVEAKVEHLPHLIEEACELAFIETDALNIAHWLDLDADAQWVRADRIQIQQVLINLVRNAIEAMEGRGGEIVISTRVEGKMIAVEVADTGGGIPAEQIDRLFSEFMTTKPEGMGLGLPISRTIVEAHGGKIWAANRPGGGASFSFTIPREREPVAG